MKMSYISNHLQHDNSSNNSCWGHFGMFSGLWLLAIDILIQWLLGKKLQIHRSKHTKMSLSLNNAFHRKYWTLCQPDVAVSIEATLCFSIKATASLHKALCYCDVCGRSAYSLIRFSGGGAHWIMVKIYGHIQSSPFYATSVPICYIIKSRNSHCLANESSNRVC